MKPHSRSATITIPMAQREDESQSARPIENIDYFGFVLPKLIVHGLFS
jgi:hypothetical protein